MKKKVWGMILSLVFVGILGVIGVWRLHHIEVGVTRCLLIGCDRFVSMPGTEPASANNVETMEALLKDFLPESTTVIRQMNGPGTVAGFEQIVADAFRRARKEDTALIYLSTHGLLTDGQMSLLLSDGEKEEELFPETLRGILDEVTGRKVLILDACHSGAVIGCGWDGENAFEHSDCRVLVSSSAMEDSWFWNTETDEYTGTGYFTAAMDRALRASDPEQIDSDGNGEVSLKELTGRLQEIHGASTVYCFPEESKEKLFSIPTDRKTGSRLQGVSFGGPSPEGDALILPIRFRAGESVRVMYQLVPGRNGKWDFEHAVKLPDKEKTGLIRGLLSPGEKERKIRLSVSSIGDDGRALLQIISYNGDNLIPSVEAGTVISIQNP